MSVMIPWRHAVLASDLSATTKLIALTIAAHMNQDGRAWLSAETIGAESSTSRRTAQRHVPKLEHAGLLMVVHTAGRECNTYQAIHPTASSSDAVTDHLTASNGTPNRVKSTTQPRHQVTHEMVEMAEMGKSARLRERSNGKSKSYDDLPEGDPAVVGVRSPADD